MGVAQTHERVVWPGWVVFTPGNDSRAGGRIHAGAVSRARDLPGWSPGAHSSRARAACSLPADASNDAVPVLLGPGFQAVTTTTAYVCTPSRPCGGT